MLATTTTMMMMMKKMMMICKTKPMAMVKAMPVPMLISVLN